jgi:DNA-binding NarL/FixJ family response regulator
MSERILLADDHIVVREGVRGLLLKEGFRIAGEASDGHEAVRLAKELQPDVAVLDLSMPLLNGLDAAREIQRISPRIKTVLLTMYKEDQYVVEALKAGVRGYILKSQAAVDLVQAIRDVLRGAIYLSPGVSPTIVRDSLTTPSPVTHDLTSREREVLQLVAEGKTTKEIAHILDISVKTADSHRTSIMAKLDLHETASLVRYAIRNGMIQP